MDSRELQYKKNLENQRELFEEKMTSLNKQLRQGVEINDLAKMISQSSGSITALKAKLDVSQTGNLQQRENEILTREKVLQ